MSDKRMSFEVKDLKNLENPMPDMGNVYMMTLDVRAVPSALKNWRSINVRDPNMTKQVAEDISNSLLALPNEFHMKNRGLTIIADRLSYDNKAKIVTLSMTDEDQHGLLDGGHTFNVIMEELANLQDKDPEKYKELESYVRIEVIEGLRDKELGIEIVEARNNSLQVQDESIAELKGEFDLVKLAIEDESYANNVAYKQFEWNEDYEPKQISISEILSVLMCFDADFYKSPINPDKRNHPTGAAMTKKRVLAHFKNKQGDIRKYIPMLPSFLALRDRIYHDVGLSMQPMITGAEKWKCIKEKDIPLHFVGKEAKYFVPIGFIYPILAAFRSLIKVQGRKAEWERDPVTFWAGVREEAVQSIVESAKAQHKPAYVSKEPSVWSNLYGMFELARLKS